MFSEQIEKKALEAAIEENVMLRALLAEIEIGMDHALTSDAPAEVLETLRAKIWAVNKK